MFEVSLRLFWRTMHIVGTEYLLLILFKKLCFTTKFDINFLICYLRLCKTIFYKTVHVRAVQICSRYMHVHILLTYKIKPFLLHCNFDIPGKISNILVSKTPVGHISNGQGIGFPLPPFIREHEHQHIGCCCPPLFKQVPEIILGLSNQPT